MGVAGMIRGSVYQTVVGKSKLFTGLIARWYSLMYVLAGILIFTVAYISQNKWMTVADIIVGLSVGYLIERFIQRPAIEKAIVGKGKGATP